LELISIACSGNRLPLSSEASLSYLNTVPQTSRSDTQIRQCMHGMQRMHAHFFYAIL
jgi:hypothetical protein